MTIEATVVCHDLARAGQRVDHVAVEPTFVGAYVSSRAPDAFLDAGDVVVCRDGVVAERAAYEQKGPPDGFGFGRGDLVAMAVGPAVDLFQDELRSEAIRMSDAPWFRSVGSVASSVVSSLAIALAIGWRRRLVPWWVLPGMLLGPGYALSCLLLLWRRPRWASALGGA